jgi:hypothetical protein
MEPTAVDARMLLKDRLVIGSGALVVLFLGLAAWQLFGGSDAEADNDPGKHFTHMHCSACKEEMAYDPRGVGQTCAMCGAGVYVATVSSLEDQEESLSVTGRIWVYLLFAAVLLQALAYITVAHWRRLRRAADEFLNRLLVCRCPFCQRKIGYRAPRVGAGVVCPRCKTAFELPAAEDSAFAQSAIDLPH